MIVVSVLLAAATAAIAQGRPIDGKVGLLSAAAHNHVVNAPHFLRDDK